MVQTFTKPLSTGPLTTLPIMEKDSLGFGGWGPGGSVVVVVEFEVSSPPPLPPPQPHGPRKRTIKIREKN
jgi:hypothetical protein